MKKSLISFKESVGPHYLDHIYDDYIVSGDVACCRGRFMMKDYDGQVIGEGK